jgi:hypothetical protein
MKQRKVISLPTNQNKIYKQILAFMNFMLNLTPQERDVLAELIRLDNEYSALPEDKRAKFILSTDMRKEIRDLVKIEEKQFNVIISRLKKKLLFNKPLIDDNNLLHQELRYKPDQDGFRIEVNLVMTSTPTTAPAQSFTESLEETMVEQQKESEQFVSNQVWGNQETDQVSDRVPPAEYQHDAAKAPVIEEETFDFTIAPPDEEY